MKPSQLVAAVAAGAIAIMLAATGAAAAPASPSARGLDLSTPASIAAYLASKGVDPATVVWQAGAQNYAGPNCPGIGWTCTTSANVVQIAQAGGQNKFECDPAFFGDGDPPFPLPEDVVTDPLANTCVIVQINESGEGQNHARCFERSTSTPEAVLTCLVYQENAAGDNFLQIHQRVQQSAGAQQLATVDVDVTQRNDSGNNHAQLVQQVFQSTSDLADLDVNDEGDEQEQRAMFDIDPLTQDTQTGNNYVHLTQHLSQNGTADGPPTTSQAQFSNQFGDVDQFAVAGESLVTSQVTGQGFSQAFAHQSEQQQLHGPGFQEQVGPQGCCGAGTQVGDPQQTSMNILQESSQDADGPLVEQDQDILGSCNSSGVCDLTHHARNIADSTSESNRGTGPTFLTTTCDASREGTAASGDCETVPAPPGD